jgi:hypothetical protein
MNKFFVWLMNPPTDGPRSTLILRLMAGGVFFWEGLLKFVYANQGVGRFTKLGMPFPHFTANFIGCLEIVSGLLLLSGLMTRLIVVPFVGEMIVAILDQDFVVSGNLAPASATGASPGWVLGGAARGPIRIRPDADGSFSPGERPREVVAGCSAAAQMEKRRRLGSRPIGQAAGFVAGRQPLKPSTIPASAQKQKPRSRERGSDLAES